MSATAIKHNENPNGIKYIAIFVVCVVSVTNAPVLYYDVTVTNPCGTVKGKKKGDEN